MEPDKAVIKTAKKPHGWAKPGPGRPKGLLNKSTVEIKELARQLLTSPTYLRNLKKRLEDGDAGPIEVQLYYYGYGKPWTDSVIVPVQQITINQEVKPEDNDPYSQFGVVFQNIIASGIVPDDLLSRLNGNEDAILIGHNGSNGRKP